MKKIISLEICVDHIESAIIAENAGADRLELCQALEFGGLTPSMGLIAMAKEKIKVPIFMMIRPRSGDFFYSPNESLQMLKDIEFGVSMDVDGFVTGALRQCGKEVCVDEDLCQKLIEAAKGKPVTFNRAFDMTTCDVKRALESIITLGFSRLLTSGRASTAIEGLPLIRELLREAKDRIIIMPGSGLSGVVIRDVYEGTKAREYHASAVGPKCEPPEEFLNPPVKGTNFCDTANHLVVRSLRSILDEAQEEDYC